MTFSQIRFETQDAIAVMTLNRPDIRNAITGQEMIEEIETVCRRVNTDLTYKVLIVAAEDPAFSAGGNVKDMAAKTGMFGGTPAQVAENYRNHVQRIPLAMHKVAVPTIAAVNGPAVGAGCDLALMCDMRIASEKAKFAESFLNVGLIPGDGGAWFLPRIVGMARACEMTFTGQAVDAQKALEYGLVNETVPHGELMASALDLGRRIALQPPEALRMAKKLLYLSNHATLEQLLEQSAAFQALCHHSEDHLEALAAMFEKRPAHYKGR